MEAEAHGCAAKSPFAVARERLGLAAPGPAAGDRGLQGGSWPPRAACSHEAPEGCSDDESVAMWQELCEEGSATGSMACAAANAAAALAHGGPLPPGTAAAVRRNSVPRLLTLDVQLPAWKHRGLEARAPGSADPAADGLKERKPGSPCSSNQPTFCAPASPTTGAGSPGSSHSGTSSPGRYNGSDPTTLHMAMACAGYPQGTCTFTLSSPASEAERQHLASFCGRLGCELERARYHLAKQQLEGSLDELSQALVSGGASSLRSASLPEGLTLPTLPSWRSTCSTPAGASHGWGGGSGSSAASSAAASPMFRACTLPEEARQEPALDAMDEGA